MRCQAELARLREEIAEGCRDMCDVLLEIEREFHPLEEEVERKNPDGIEWRAI